MLHSRIKLAGIILILFITACREKDELTLPVRIHFKILLDWGGYEYLYFNGGQIGIQKIRFEGKREAGGDIFFETEPNIDLPPIKIGQQPAIISDFDIPQGIYNYMKWDIYLKKIKTDEAIVDLDTDSPDIGLVINGACINEDWPWIGDWDSKPFVLAIDNTEQFSVRSYNSENGDLTIVLSGNKDYDADLSLYLGYAFSSVYWDLFEILNDSLPHKNMISSKENRNVYDIILNRINTTAKVIIR